MDEAEIRKASIAIAVKCRGIIMSLLRDEEIADCDREFQAVAEEVIRGLSLYKDQ